MPEPEPVPKLEPVPGPVPEPVPMPESANHSAQPPRRKRRRVVPQIGEIIHLLYNIHTRIRHYKNVLNNRGFRTSYSFTEVLEQALSTFRFL